VIKGSSRVLYLDNSSTSFPKAPGVAARMSAYVEGLGGNPGRGTYASSIETAQVVHGVREKLCRVFSFDEPSRVIFTGGQTLSLNMGLKGFLKQGDRVVVTSFEHNAVMRPLGQLGVEVTALPADEQGRTNPVVLEALLQDVAAAPVAMVVATHASNVSGTLQPIDALATICRAYDVPLLIDAAQTAGHCPLSWANIRPSILCIPAHKGLLGPQGLGVMMLDAPMAARLEPLIAGGTGSASLSELPPPFLPDRFEAGTLNLPGIFGLDAALDYLEQRGIEALWRHERALCAQFLQAVTVIEGVRLVGPQSEDGRVGVFSLDFINRDNSEVAWELEHEFDILTRCGLHCAPTAHRALGTFPQGTVRLSVSAFTTPHDLASALRAIELVALRAEA
jgi:cysteine desulfurase family protein